MVAVGELRPYYRSRKYSCLLRLTLAGTPARCVFNSVRTAMCESSGSYQPGRGDTLRLGIDFLILLIHSLFRAPLFIIATIGRLFR